jgi:hypothetical protein
LKKILLTVLAFLILTFAVSGGGFEQASDEVQVNSDPGVTPGG